MASHKALQHSPLQRPAFRRLWLGLVIFCFQLPTILSSPLMGKLLDRYQARTIMAVDNFGRACIVGAMPLLYVLGALHLSMVYVLALLSALLLYCFLMQVAFF